MLLAAPASSSAGASNSEGLTQGEFRTSYLQLSWSPGGHKNPQFLILYWTSHHICITQNPPFSLLPLGHPFPLNLHSWSTKLSSGSGSLPAQGP